ncbi:hypothetical protein B0J13DRAFT_566472 [Dactylonectria estremocensis]|uniref:Uncharacterized protein n=1 Tax=Dactylonectria estremocensis TaxID=1079267 RepID=A0A9P9IK12_9HYPO|nr:hypothetical protein B0J13DRAFT_566472 [Dactylonectria estremocensis]
MAQPTESDILAALGRYRAQIVEVTHRAMLAIIPVVEEAHIEMTDSGVSARQEEELRFNYLDRLVALPEGNTQPPIERPSDVLTHWDLIAQQVSLDGTTILMRHVDGLEGHGWAMLREITERLVFWVGWGTEGILETHESIQQRVMTGEAILDETEGLDEMNDYDIAGGWLSGGGGESNVFVFYSRPKEDESQGWSWRYVAAQGQFGIEFFDDIVAVLDWYRDQDAPLEIEFKVTAEDVFSP